MLLAVSKEGKNVFISFNVLQNNFRFGFVISRIIKVSVNVIRLSLRLRLIIINNNCLSTIFRGEYQELQNNGLEHKNTNPIVHVYVRMQL